MLSAVSFKGVGLPHRGEDFLAFVVVPYVYEQGRIIVLPEGQITGAHPKPTTYSEGTLRSLIVESGPRRSTENNRI